MLTGEPSVVLLFGLGTTLVLVLTATTLKGGLRTNICIWRRHRIYLLQGLFFFFTLWTWSLLDTDGIFRSLCFRLNVLSQWKDF